MQVNFVEISNAVILKQFMLTVEKMLGSEAKVTKTSPTPSSLKQVKLMQYGAANIFYIYSKPRLIRIFAKTG